jgi:hypothetical protein
VGTRPFLADIIVMRLTILINLACCCGHVHLFDAAAEANRYLHLNMFEQWRSESHSAAVCHTRIYADA